MISNGEDKRNISSEAANIHTRLNDLEDVRERLKVIQEQLGQAEMTVEKLQREYQGSRQKLEALSAELQEQVQVYLGLC